MSQSGIYIIENTRNGKFYIGSARDFKERKTTHFRHLRQGKHICDYLQRAYNKEVNKAVFVYTPLLFCAADEATLLENEQCFLNLSRDAKDRGVLYNSSMIAGRIEHTPEVCAKLSAANKGSANPSAKLTEDDVLYIRTSTERNVDLAKKFGIDPTNMSEIRRGFLWRHVKGQVATTRFREKLTENDVLYIRRSSERNVDLAKKFGVHRNYISDIRRRLTWKHI